MDRLTPKQRSQNMRQIRSEDTAPEMQVRRLVHRMGFRFRLHVRSLPGKPDLVLARLGKIIEVRGCFWHQHGPCSDSRLPLSRRDYWIPKLRANKERDAANCRALRRLGWSVMTVWECQTRNETRLRQRLLRYLEK